MLLVLDNYDSFTYNLVQYAGELGADPVVYRNDALTRRGRARAPARGHRDLARALHAARRPASPCRWSAPPPAAVPVLGVCLGHQAIGEAFGGQVVRADRLMHGKTTMVAHTGHPLFAGLPSPFEVDAVPLAGGGPRDLPEELEVTAWSDDRPAGRKSWRCATARCRSSASSFTPNRSRTHQGKRLLANFLELAA